MSESASFPGRRVLRGKGVGRVDRDESWVELACSLLAGFGEVGFKEAYLERVAGIVPARAYGFYLLRPERLEPYDLVVSGVPKGFIERYEQIRRHDLVFLSALRSRRPYHSDMLELGIWREGPTYGLLSEYGIPRCMDCPVISAATGQPLGVVNIARGDEDPPFSPEEVRWAALICRLTGAAVDHYNSLRRPQVIGRVLEVFHQAPVSIEVLTRRETDIAICVMRGLTNQEICDALHLSPNTVKMHLKSIFDKLKVRNRCELTGRLVRLDLSWDAVGRDPAGPNDQGPPGRRPH